jgi:hypothetical protein
MARRFRFTKLAVAVCTLVGLASAAASQASPVKTVTTKSYVMRLSLGMSEPMWTPAQAKATHPKSGEIMLTGMMMGGAMPMGGGQRHLEVHITSRASGKVVAGAYPMMTLVDTTARHAMTTPVHVAEMQGVTAGPADVHYGNNVSLVPGHVYRITVTLNGETAVFHATAPK